MQDFKKQSKQRPAARRFWTSSEAVRKNRSKPIHGTSVKIKQRPDSSKSLNRFISFLQFEDSATLKNRTKWLLSKTFAFSSFMFAIWLIGGSIWISQEFFTHPLKRVSIDGNLILSESEVLQASGLVPGQHLYRLDPFEVASSLQQHAVIQNADVRRIFPNKIQLTLSEYKAVALLKIKARDHVLIDEEQRLLRRINTKELQNSPFSNLPLIKGVVVDSFKLGVRLNSPVLERGLRFIKTFQEMSIPESKELSEPEQMQEGAFGIAERSSIPVEIDVSDPLNLKMNWPLKLRQQQVSMSQSRDKTPLTVLMGNRNFEERIQTLKTIYPTLDKQHPGLRSIDLRYGNKVMLVP